MELFTDAHPERWALGKQPETTHDLDDFAPYVGAA
jgi:hypothetical protein